MPNEAYNEYQRIRNLSAFSINAKRRNVNQHMREYTFNDGSTLLVYRSGKAVVPHMVVGQLRVNAFGR